MALDIEHEFMVNAPASVVWDVICDLDKYPEWNPFVVHCVSSKLPGDPIVMRVRMAPFYTLTQTEFVQEYEEGKTFSYSMKPLPRGLMSSHRRHQVTPIDDNRCTYRSSFTIAGPFSVIAKVLLAGSLRRGFTGMSESIKARAEKLAA